MKTTGLVIICICIAGPIQAQKLVKLSDAQKKEFIEVHNQWRSDVGTAPLAWSEDMAKFAGEWALNLGKTCQMQHRPQSGKWEQKYGENIYWISNSSGNPTAAVNAWGSEIKYYKKPKPIDRNNYSKYGHYTQLVWKNTKQVGCAIVSCKNGGTIIVCNYDPPGNWIGETAYD